MLTDMQIKYDLEDRLLKYAKDIRLFIRELPRNHCNTEDGIQLIRSSGSVGANYIEANEHLGTKDLLMRLRISKKEAKESIFWLRIIDTGTNDKIIAARDKLLQESKEILLILGSIYKRLK